MRIPRSQQAQQAGAVLPTTKVTTEATTEIDDDVDVHHCLKMTLETNVLHLAVNENKKELRVMKEVSLEKAVLLPSNHYHYDPGNSK